MLIAGGVTAGVWFAVPKGENQTFVFLSFGNSDAQVEAHRLIRTMVSLSMTCCVLMWAVVYLAQLHPLVGMSFASRAY